MNEGKKFEQDFKNSVTDDIFFYRFKDGTASWDGGQNTRFQAKNMCDCLMFKDGVLVFAELKSHKGKSIPFTTIRQNQLEELQINQRGVRTGFIFNMRDVEKTYWIDAVKVKESIELSERKSIPLDFMEEIGHYIPSYKKRTRCSYDVEQLITYLKCSN